MQQGQQQQHQQQQEEHMFWGIYAGLEYSLGEYLKEIDPNFQIFQNVYSYIGAFPFTMEYFNRVYPFYSSSRVSDATLYSIYETSFIMFVKMFKLNHPDWFEYTQTDCLQHFISFIEMNPNPTEYYSDTHESETYPSDYERLNTTPQTVEKPHYSAYRIDHSDSGEYTEYYIGSGYFRYVDGEEVPYDRRMGNWGPNAIRDFDIYRRIVQLEQRTNPVERDLYDNDDDDDDDERRYRVRPIQFYLYNGTRFDISIDASGGKRHMRFIENENDDLFLFEESFQDEKRRIQDEKRRIQDENMRLYQLQIKKYRESLLEEKEKEKQENMKKIKAKKSQQKIENERKKKENFEKQLKRWANFNAAAYINHPAMIEMAQKFSVPLEPFVYRNLPVPVALPSEHRTPYLKEEIDEMLDEIFDIVDE